MNWKITPDQEAVLGNTLRDKTVVDLGAGNGSLAARCLELGARSITAIDCEPQPHFKSPQIRWVFQTFAETPATPADVALLSWPWEHNQTAALITHLQTCPIIIVLACTTDGSSCGNPALWKYLSRLKVSSVLPDTKNTLIVYHNEKRRNRRLLRLEAAGLDIFNIASFHHSPWEPKSPVNNPTVKTYLILTKKLKNPHFNARFKSGDKSKPTFPAGKVFVVNSEDSGPGRTWIHPIHRFGNLFNLRLEDLEEHFETHQPTPWELYQGELPSDSAEKILKNLLTDGTLTFKQVQAAQQQA